MKLISLNILAYQHTQLKTGSDPFSVRIRKLLTNAHQHNVHVARRTKGDVNNEPRVRTSVQVPEDLFKWLRKLGTRGELRATVDDALEGGLQ